MLCQISKFDFEMFLFNLASENLTVTIKWKIKKKIVCWACTRREWMPILSFFTAINEEKLDFFLSLSKTILSILVALNKNVKFIFLNIEFSYWRVFFDVKGRYLKMFQKILIFKVPAIFFLMKTLPRVRSWTHKHITDQQQCAHFRKSQKCGNHSPLVYTILPHFIENILHTVQHS